MLFVGLSGSVLFLGSSHANLLVLLTAQGSSRQIIRVLGDDCGHYDILGSS